jgi:hypothetical protein
MNINLTITLLLSINFCCFSCNESKDDKIEKIQNINSNALSKYDSVKYYKDADWISFEGLGEAHNRPLEKYPYISFNYKGDTVDIVVFYSDTKQTTVQLRKLINQDIFFYSTEDYERDYGQNMMSYYLIDRKNKSKIYFFAKGKMNFTENTDINEVKYYTKYDDKYIIDTYNLISDSDKEISWQKIIKKDTSFLIKSFCYNRVYIEEFKFPILYVNYSKITTLCNEKNTIEIDSSRRKLTNPVLEYPTIFYLKASSGNGFKKVNN